jgi:1,5-anhydro-D-fructose reductase (1,5-anhydro-D-mannitol-forming)
MAERVRIGIVGCGRILPAHLRGYRLLREAGVDDFRVTALVARRPEDAAMFRVRGEGPPPRPPVSHNPSDPLAAPHLYVSDFQPEEEARIYPTVEAMLAAGAIDAVDITATLPVHHTAGLACLAAGKHAMIQKPLAVSVAAGRRLVEAAEARGLTLAVMENVRYVEPVRVARWLIERGEVGALQMMTWARVGTQEWSPDIVVADTPWRHDMLIAGGGAAMDIGVHLAHWLRHVIGEVRTMTAVARVLEPERVRRDAGGAIVERVAADADDAFFALPEFENGVIGSFSFTWAGHGEPTTAPEGLAIYGDRGSLKGTTLVRDGGERVDGRDLFRRQADAATRARFYPHGLTDTFALGYLDWLTAIRAGRQPETSGMEGLRDLATAFAILESSASGGPVRVADVLSGRVNAYQRPIDAHHGLV